MSLIALNARRPHSSRGGHRSLFEGCRTHRVAAVNMLLDAWTAALGQPAYVATTVTDLLGRPAHSFRDWAQRNALAFAGGQAPVS